MPLLPLRVLPINGAHGGQHTIRVDIRASGSAYVYVRRESDKKTWSCTVRTLQEILAPSQQTSRSLDLVSVIMCLYHGFSYDSSSGEGYSTGPVELRRREVGFTQPESWPDDGYRLTVRVCVRSTSVAAPFAQTVVASDDAPIAAIPIVDVADDDVVFGLNFVASDTNLDHEEIKLNKLMKRRATLAAASTTFANNYVQWEEFKDTSFLRITNDGVIFNYDSTYRIYFAYDLEVEVHIVHAKHAGAALFVLSINSKFATPVDSTSYTSMDLQHTVARYVLKAPARAFLQVVLLPGSACAVDSTKMTFRELGSA